MLLTKLPYYGIDGIASKLHLENGLKRVVTKASNNCQMLILIGS
jgi:hypothetical protein